MIVDYKDFTIKARLRNFEAVEISLAEMNSIFIGVDNQTDCYFETEKGKLKWRRGTIENLITHYERSIENGIERTTVYQYDKDPSQEKIEALKHAHKQIGIVEKERRIYLMGNVKIHLDRMKDGKCFIEIEAIDRNGNFTDSELAGQCLNLKTKLGIQDSEMVRTGYFPFSGSCA